MCITASLGKEFAKNWFWNSRIYGIAGMGLANKGSPWIRARFAAEGNAYDRQHWGGFVNYQMGLGEHELFLRSYFPGYGSIKYRVLNVGGYYQYILKRFGSIRWEYELRLYAKNAAQYTNAFSIRYVLPFSVY